MRVLLTGAGGQVGAELARRAPRGVDVVALDRAGLDIRREADVRAVVSDVGPDLILNAAAYTAVDRAESEPEEAFAVNEAGARALAAAAAAAGGRMLHLSTDFVFSGNGSQWPGLARELLAEPVFHYRVASVDEALRGGRIDCGRAVGPRRPPVPPPSKGHR